jgi:hypothetical protein
MSAAATPHPHPEEARRAVSKDRAPPRFAAPAAHAGATRLSLVGISGESLGDWRIPGGHPPIYLQRGEKVFALQRCCPDPSPPDQPTGQPAPETLAVYLEIALYQLADSARLGPATVTK